MKKAIVFLMLALLLIGTLASCGNANDSSGPIEALPAPQRPPYVPEPLNVEFFSTGYTNMTPWQKYPNKNTVTTEAVTSDETPTSTEEPVSENE